MAVNSDRTRLFVTVPNPSGAAKGQILVYNIDPKDRPTNSTSNANNWHRQIGKVDAGLGVEGIAATPDPLKMVFTNRNEDAKGFGLLEITSNNPTGITAKTTKNTLNLVWLLILEYS
ncbi:hypothetical protein [Microseira wollei]|uniref:Uncharacterized protein n=1 Tax=Microseira wollei NIES-4236 TaxID=2530354 RepID=A0AAV3WPG6_9CYAN|nr:hypothetical protein [Microseira wollei]GET43929.1 hypothetical protein MiSe_87550 [Microseira wollei NIES-4236]